MLTYMPSSAKALLDAVDSLQLYEQKTHDGGRLITPTPEGGVPFHTVM
jgi:hypothetical protein